MYLQGFYQTVGQKPDLQNYYTYLSSEINSVDNKAEKIFPTVIKKKKKGKGKNKELTDEEVNPLIQTLTFTEVSQKDQRMQEL